MAKRVVCTALVTLNVFQNSLARHNSSWQYYANLLFRLPSLPVDWYMTRFDYDAARYCFACFGQGVEERCQEAYLSMLDRVKCCAIADSIHEESGNYQINFYDSLRLACAMDYNLDFIVTWEPHHYAQTAEDNLRVQVDRCLSIRRLGICVESGLTTETSVGVFSVEKFLLHLHELRDRPMVPGPKLEPFSLTNFCFETHNDHNQVTVRLRVLDWATEVDATACGASPFEAIQRAIDQAIEPFVQIPLCQLRRFFIPPATLSGADAPVEVVITVEGGDLIVENSACSSNCVRAAADAYLKVINSVIDLLQIPVQNRTL